MIKAIIFDCFGVLYPDTFWAMARKNLGHDCAGKEDELHNIIYQADIGKIDRNELWKQFAGICGVSYEDVMVDLKDFDGLDKRLLEFIEDKKTDYKIGMISNVGQGFLERMFTDKPAEHYFNFMALSSTVGIVKPDERIYTLTAEKLGVKPEECLFVDDIDRNVEGAKNAGMQAFKYQSYEQFITEIGQYLANNY